MKIRRSMGIADNVYRNAQNNNSNVIYESLKILGNEVEWEEFGGIPIINFEGGEIHYGPIETLIIFYDWRYGVGDENTLTSSIRIAA